MQKMNKKEKPLWVFTFVGISKHNIFLLCDVINVESCLLIFTGKSSESLSRIYIVTILILLHNKCSTQFLCYVQFSHYVYCYMLISFFIVS